MEPSPVISNSKSKLFVPFESPTFCVPEATPPFVCIDRLPTRSASRSTYAASDASSFRSGGRDGGMEKGKEWRKGNEGSWDKRLTVIALLLIILCDCFGHPDLVVVERMPLFVIIKLVDAVDFATKYLLSLDRVHFGTSFGDLCGEPLLLSGPVDVEFGARLIAVVC